MYCENCYRALTSTLSNGNTPSFCSPTCKRHYDHELKEYTDLKQKATERRITIPGKKWLRYQLAQKDNK